MSVRSVRLSARSNGTATHRVALALPPILSNARVVVPHLRGVAPCGTTMSARVAVELVTDDVRVIDRNDRCLRHRPRIANDDSHHGPACRGRGAFDFHTDRGDAPVAMNCRTEFFPHPLAHESSTVAPWAVVRRIVSPTSRASCAADRHAAFRPHVGALAARAPAATMVRATSRSIRPQRDTKGNPLTETRGCFAIVRRKGRISGVPGCHAVLPSGSIAVKSDRCRRQHCLSGHPLRIRTTSLGAAESMCAASSRRRA
jgi:hypothetical protein